MNWNLIVFVVMANIYRLIQMEIFPTIRKSFDRYRLHIDRCDCMWYIYIYIDCKRAKQCVHWKCNAPQHLILLILHSIWRFFSCDLNWNLSWRDAKHPFSLKLKIIIKKKLRTIREKNWPNFVVVVVFCPEFLQNHSYLCA